MTKKFDLFVIDDDQNIIDIVVLMLADYQLSIKTFTDPLEGIRELIENPPQVAFIDYNMPLLNGKDLIIKMSEHYLFRYCSVYLITGMNFDQLELMQLKTLGFSQIITKPFNKECLLKALAETITIIEKGT